MATTSRGRAIRDAQAKYMVRHGLGAHTALHLAYLMDAVPGLVITSGRRTPARNAAVGGSPRSFHLRGRAIDLVAPLPRLQTARDVAWRQRLGGRCTGPEEVLLEDVGTRNQHLHVAW